VFAGCAAESADNHANLVLDDQRREIFVREALPGGATRVIGGWELLQHLVVKEVREWAVTHVVDARDGDRVFWFTTTGWMMWNFLVTSLLSGVVPVLYDGNPAWPGPDQLWKVVQDFKIDLFGASPTYQQILEKQGIVPKDRFDLSHLKTVMLAGSPVTPECMVWFYNHVKSDLWVQSGSGGTDICSGFCGGVPTQPVYAGEIQAPHLGVNLLAFDADGKPVLEELWGSQKVLAIVESHDMLHVNLYHIYIIKMSLSCLCII
jgi:acyl-coenzyme A synthetase/AMP-(fatty) acid ligase